MGFSRDGLRAPQLNSFQHLLHHMFFLDYFHIKPKTSSNTSVFYPVNVSVVICLLSSLLLVSYRPLICSIHVVQKTLRCCRMSKLRVGTSKRKRLNLISCPSAQLLSSNVFFVPCESTTIQLRRYFLVSVGVVTSSFSNTSGFAVHA